jgi:hypothetical protein
LQDALPEQGEAGPAIALALEELQAGNLGFQEHLPENVRLGDMRDWRTVPSTVKTEV